MQNAVEENWAPPAQEETFVVRFGEGGAFGVGARPTDTLGWVGEAKVTIGPDGVFLQGKGGRSGKPMEKRLAFEGISDVHATGTVVRFDMPRDDQAQARFVQFNAVEQSKTERILQLLPRTLSPAFEQQLRELGDFQARLDACSGPPRVTPVLVALNALVFAAMLVDGAGLMQLDPEVHLRWGSNYGPLTVEGQWWRLLASAFIHFGLIHLAFNMYALWSLGGVTERLYGRARFLSLYLFAALTSSLASIWWHSDPVNAAGASGAIFGLLGGLLAFVLRPRNRLPKAMVAAHRNTALLWGAYSLFYGAAHAGIDNAAHVGGLLGGFAIGLLLARPVDPAVRARPAVGQLVGALLGGALILGGGVWAVLHPGTEAAQVRAYESFRIGFAAREEAALEQMKVAGRMAQTGDIAGMHEHMQDAARQWRALERELRGIDLRAPVESVHQRELFLNYVAARRRYCELAAQWRQGDETASIEAADLEAQTAVAALNADNKK